MAKKFFSTEILTQAQTLKAAWIEIDPDLHFGTLTLQGMAGELDKAWKLEEELDRLESILVEKRTQREGYYTSIWTNMKRIRSAVKGIYGDDSAEYEMVGGKRLSERKSPARRVTA